MMKPSIDNDSNESAGSIDLVQMWNELRASRNVVFWSGLAGLLLGIAVAFFSPTTFRAEALLAPAETTDGGMGSLMQQYGGIASLAGVALPGDDGATRAKLGIATLESRDFLKKFVHKYDLLPELMAAKSWDSETLQLTLDENDFNVEKQSWVRKVAPPLKAEPSHLEAYEKFTEIMSVKQSKDTGFVTISIDHISPVLAAEWVTLLVKELNQTIREQDIVEAKRSIDFLEKQVKNTSLTDLHAVFFDLIQSQTEKMMLAEVRPEYVFKVIDPAVPPEKESSLPKLLALLMSLFFSMSLGCIWVLVRTKAAYA